MATHHLGMHRARSAGGGTLGIPWWYRFVHSWRARMWIETGIWLADSTSSVRRNSH